MSEFCVDKSRKDGLTIYCKECIKTREGIRIQKYPEKVSASKKLHVLKYPWKKKKSVDKYRKNNPDKIRDSYLKGQYGITLV